MGDWVDSSIINQIRIEYWRNRKFYWWDGKNKYFEFVDFKVSLQQEMYKYKNINIKLLSTKTEDKIAREENVT